MPVSQAKLTVGCFVVIPDLKHPRLEHGQVFGRVAHLNSDELKVSVVVAEDLGFGYAIELQASQVRCWEYHGDIPVGQLEHLGFPPREILPGIF